MTLLIQRARLSLAFLSLTVIISGCIGNPDSMRTIDKQSYIDARLGFAISYPQSWAAHLTRPETVNYAEHSVRWKVDTIDGNGTDITLTIVALQHYGFTAETVIAEVLQEFHPNLVTVSRKEVELTGGDAIRSDGYTPHRTVRSWSFANDHRLFLIICTAPPESFERQAALFTEVADSFRVLP